MACSVPICYLLERQTAEGQTSLLMSNDLATAIADAASDPAFRPIRITFGRETVLEGAALAAAIAESRAA